MQCAPSSGPDRGRLRALAHGALALDASYALGVAVSDAAAPLGRGARRRSATLAALSELRVAPAKEPGVGAAGEPIWPDGVVGSISHSEDCSVAIVAPVTAVGGVGIDIERDVPVTAAFARRVCSDAETAHVRGWAATPDDWALVVFSAKEAVYKLQFPHSREVVGLRRVEIELQPDERFVATFREELPPFGRGFAIEGRWRRQHGMILTSAWLRVAWAMPRPTKEKTA